MDPERWARVKELFHAALEREPTEHERFLRDACGGDEQLRETVAAMLARQPDAIDFLESPATQRLAAVSGTRLGPYEVIGLLGAGGMGEVYRARDTRLGRDVAIKVLPEHVARNPEALRRFDREARAVAALSHPHIAALFDIGEADGTHYMVMELLEGETLTERLKRGVLSERDALRMAIPIADALAAAHSRGIVHRDLKPANVIVTREGVVKVLDFGLAKLVAEDAGETAETLTTASGSGALTRPGVVAGTAGYMSPEQATGGQVDARSDVFSFGAVLYEMVTGRRAFAARTALETLAAVVRDQPMAPRELVPGIPETLERLILRCLRKEPERRFQQMSDVKVDLEEAKEESDSQARASAGVAVSKRRSGRRWTLWAVAVSIPAVAAAVALWAGRPALPPPSVVQLTSERWAGAGSFSPDGTQIAYASAGDDGANWDIWIKIVGETEARRLTTDALADGYPAWSPDGTQIAFLRLSTGSSRGDLAWWSHSGAVHLVSPQGGPERRLSEWPARLQPSWSPDGRWLAVSKARSGSDPPGGIHLVSVSSGETRAVTFPQPPAFDFSPSFSPNGRELAYASCKGAEGYPVCEVSLLSLDGELRPQGAARSLTRQGLSNRGLAWTRDGRSIVYGADDRLWRVRADGGAPPERLEIVARGAFPSTLGSRDRLAFTRETADSDIYRLDLGGSAVPLVQSTFVEARPQYSPDGRRIAFDSSSGVHGAEIWLADADGSNPARLTRGPGRHQGSPHWSPDGRVIAFDSRAESGHVNIWTIGVSGSGLRQVTHDPADEVVPSFSRDGRFIYFASNRTGRFELGRVAADGGREEQVTHEGGVLPIESFDGRTLYYLRSENGALLSRPTAGGGEHMIRPCVVTWGWAVGPRGLFHEDCGGLDAAVSAQRSLRYWDAVTGQDRLVATLDTDVINGLSVSPEGGSIVFGRDRETSDLMMIENFR